MDLVQEVWHGYVHVCVCQENSGCDSSPIPPTYNTPTSTTSHHTHTHTHTLTIGGDPVDTRRNRGITSPPYPPTHQWRKADKSGDDLPRPPSSDPVRRKAGDHPLPTHTHSPVVVTQVTQLTQEEGRRIWGSPPLPIHTLTSGSDPVDAGGRQTDLGITPPPPPPPPPPHPTHTHQWSLSGGDPVTQ